MNGATDFRGLVFAVLMAVIIAVVTVLAPVVTPIAAGQFNSTEIVAGPAHLFLPALAKHLIAPTELNDTQNNGPVNSSNGFASESQ